MEKLWIKPSTSLRIENNDLWGELKIKDDGVQYFDLLFGKKGKEPHAHMGINLDQKLRFLEGRGITNTIRRQIESQKYGLISDVKEIYKDVEGLNEFELKLNVEFDTGEIIIQSFRFTK